MRELFTIAIFKIKADIRMNKTTLNSQKEKHFMLSLRRATPALLPITVSISQFLSTISLRRATLYGRLPCCMAAPAFLSTLSLRRATRRLWLRISLFDNFYPRSPCGERLCNHFRIRQDAGISIHALLAESDGKRGTAKS